MGSKILIALALLLAAFAAAAGAPGEKAKAALEASMLVTGTIEVDAEGLVERFEIDQEEALPDYVNQLLARAIPVWKFAPTLHEGKPVPVRTAMRVRIAANNLDEDRITLRVAGASFGDSWKQSDGTVHGSNAPPRYPEGPLRMGVTGTVYLLCRVGLDGTVQEVIVEQVNIRYVGPERRMNWLRKDFAEASLRAAKQWTYQPPDEVIAAGDSHWSVRIPVAFEFDKDAVPGYGEWDSYVAGPTQTAWWVEDDDATSADTLAAGGIYRVGSGLRLLTPLGGKG